LCFKPILNNSNKFLLPWLRENYGDKWFINISFQNDNRRFSHNSNNVLTFQGALLGKSINKISGKAYQCKVVKYERTWSVGFFGKQFRSDESSIEILSADECWNLVHNKKCNKNNMTCDDNDHCRFEGFPKDRYTWLRTFTDTFSHCYFSPRMIAESNENSRIFTDSCKVKDFYCILGDSVVVWNKEVIHSCPFKRIAFGTFDSFGIYFKEKTLKLGFQFKRFETHCGTEFILTTEGLYLAPLTPRLPVFDSFDSFSDTRGIIDLALADEDFRAFELLEDERMILLRECNIFSSMVKIFSVMEDLFLRFRDFKNYEVILYSKGGQVYKPKCVKISSITISNSTKCFLDIPVSFVLGKWVKQGFLTHDRIIRAYSAVTDCVFEPKYISLPYISKTVVVYGNKITLLNNSEITYQKFDFFDELSFKDYSHVDSLVNGVDIIGQIHNLSIVNENGHEWLVIPDRSTSSEGVGYVLKNIKDWIMNGLSDLGKWILLGCAGILIFLLIIALIWCCVKEICVALWSRLWRQISNRSNRHPVLEQSIPMVNISSNCPQPNPLSLHSDNDSVANNLANNEIMIELEMPESKDNINLKEKRSDSVSTVALLNTVRELTPLNSTVEDV